MKEIQSDLLAVNVSWFLEDLELYDSQYGFHESFGFTAARFVTFIMAIIVHRAIYKLMKRLADRPVNQMIYPNMVRFLSSSSRFLSSPIACASMRTNGASTHCAKMKVNEKKGC